MVLRVNWLKFVDLFVNFDVNSAKSGKKGPNFGASGKKLIKIFVIMDKNE